MRRGSITAEKFKVHILAQPSLSNCTLSHFIVSILGTMDALIEKTRNHSKNPILHVWDKF